MKVVRAQIFYTHPKTGVTSRSEDGSAMVHINFGNVDSEEAEKSLSSAMTEIEEFFAYHKIGFHSEYAFPDGSLWYLLIINNYMITNLNKLLTDAKLKYVTGLDSDIIYNADLPPVYEQVKTLNIFLDDERPPSEHDEKNYVIVRSYDDFVYTITKFGIPSFISFDHDLGPGKTGHDCAKWLIEFMLDTNQKEKINFVVHSQNPVGAENIKKLIDNWNNSL